MLCCGFNGYELGDRSGQKKFFLIGVGDVFEWIVNSFEYFADFCTKKIK